MKRTKMHRKSDNPNLAILRRIALNLFKKDKTARASLANKRLRAGWNTDYLQTVLGLAPS